MIEYRRADVSDVDALVEQRFAFMKDAGADLSDEKEASFRESLHAYYSETIPTGRCVYWLASDDGGTVGGGGFALRRYAPGLMLPDGVSAYVFNIFTEPAHRRRGIAREIMLRLMDEARQRGISRLDLHAAEAGRPLYEKLGFEPPDHVYLEWAVPSRQMELPLRLE